MTKFKFAEGERVLCFHGPLIYEAKALKSTIAKDKQIKYYIHYAGWSKNWDEWVPENRVLKYNDTNVQRQKEVFKQHSATTKSKKGSNKTRKHDASSEARAVTPSKDVNNASAGGPASTSVGNANSGNSANAQSTSRGNRGNKSTTRPLTPLSKDGDNSMNSKKEDSIKDDSSVKDDHEPAKKRRCGSYTSDKSSTTPTPPNTITGNSISIALTHASANMNRIDACVESEECFLTKIEVKIKIPEELKQCLTDDWDCVTRQRKLLEIPAKLTVQDVVDQYLTFKKSSKTTNASKELAINDVMEGIMEYFNIMLGAQLLYKFERPQFTEVMQKNADALPCQLYGTFHLLRLFVRLGTLLGYSALDEKAIQNLLVYVQDFLKFLVKNRSTYFSMSNFINADSAHYRQAQ